MRKEERNRGSVRVKLIWGDWERGEPVRLHGGPGLQLNWTQETGPLGGGGGGKAGRKDTGMRLGRREF